MSKPTTTIVLSVLLCLSIFGSATATSGYFRSNEVVYQSPNNGDDYVVEQAKFIIHFRKMFIESHPLSSLRAEIFGSKSGLQQATFHLSDDGETVIVTPEHLFALDEDVHAKIDIGSTDENILLNEFSFHTTKMSFAERSAAASKLSEREYSETHQHLNTNTNIQPLPLLKTLANKFPDPIITFNTKPSAGRFFLAAINFNLAEPPPAPAPVNTAMIFENWGANYYSKQTPSFASMGDFKVQPVHNSITYFQRIAGGDQSKGISFCVYYELDANYKLIDSFQCGNGYPTDAHDFQILSNNHSLIASYDAQFVNMQTITGDPKADTAATVFGAIVQELDSNKNVVFQWRSWDHFLITDCTSDNSLTAPSIDYVHLNSLEQDHDGNIIISSRHLEEVTKINRTTGAIIWRFGGKHNQITIGNDTLSFSHQHDARRIPNGHITIFDNGNLHNPPFSRVVEYSLNEQTMQANLEWSYQDTINGNILYTYAAGNAQRLPNGNTVIGWGIQNDPVVTEITSDGTKVFEASFPLNFDSYRSFKFPWRTGVGLLGVKDAEPQTANIITTKFSVFPNPASSNATIAFTVGSSTNVTFELCDVLGRVVATQSQYFSAGGDYSAHLSLSSLSAGTYYIKAAIGGMTKTEKLIVR